MLLIRTYVAPSKIEGVGLFAEEFAAAGTLLWVFNPRFDLVFTPEEIESLQPHMRDYVRKYCFPHFAKPGLFILETDNGQFMNHSETPNTDFTPFDCGYVKTDIEPGEELTANYREFDPRFTGMFPVKQESAGVNV